MLANKNFWIFLNRCSKTLCSFMIVWITYRIPPLFIEAYHDYTAKAFMSPHDKSYVLDLLSPIYLAPELAAFSIAVYVYLNSSKSTNVAVTILCLCVSFIAYEMLVIAAHLKHLFICLDGNRPYNSFHYIATVFILIIAITPWVYQRLISKRMKRVEE